MENLVQVINNKVVVSSQQIAEKFEKEHRHVLDSIRQILAAEISATKFFKETTFENRGRQYPMYFMNRDGYSLLAMGFNGKEAIQWKIKYIDAFNAMEQELQDKNALQIKELKKKLKLANSAKKDIKLDKEYFEHKYNELQTKYNEMIKLGDSWTLEALKLRAFKSFVEHQVVKHGQITRKEIYNYTNKSELIFND